MRIDTNIPPRVDAWHHVPTVRSRLTAMTPLFVTAGTLAALWGIGGRLAGDKIGTLALVVAAAFFGLAAAIAIADLRGARQNALRSGLTLFLSAIGLLMIAAGLAIVGRVG